MAKLLEYKCPGCGSALRFDIDAKALVCASCSNQYAPEEYYESVVGTDAVVHIEGEHIDGMVSYICGSCGGEIVCDETAVTADCPFCGGTVAVLGNVSGKFFPKLLVPFRVSKEAALSEAKRYIRKNPLISKSLRQNLTIDSIIGIYIPVWVYDASVRVEPKHLSENFGGAHQFRYENIPMPATDKIPGRLIYGIGPFEFDTATRFDPSYLAGTYFHRHFGDDPEGEMTVREVVRKDVHRSFNSMMNIKLLNESLIMSGDIIKARKYGLFPVWLMKASCGEDKYTIVMNGKRGNLTTDIPLDEKLRKTYSVRTAVPVTLFFFIVLLVLVYIAVQLLLMPSNGGFIL